jgi:hypothetical protein
VNDNKFIDHAIRILDPKIGITRDDLRSAPLTQIIKLRARLEHWHQQANAEVEKRVEETRPKGEYR